MLRMPILALSGEDIPVRGQTRITSAHTDTLPLPGKQTHLNLSPTATRLGPVEISIRGHMVRLVDIEHSV